MPKSSWKGQIKLSVIVIPVKLFNAVSSTEGIKFNQLHRATNSDPDGLKPCLTRLKQKLVCPNHPDEELDKTLDIVKGYEEEKDHFIVIEPSDLDKIKLESDKTIDLTTFVPKVDIDPMHFNSVYYMTPDGKVAQEAFAVIREALRKTKKVGIGLVTMRGKQIRVMVEPFENGIMVTTLHFKDEIRGSDAYFDGIETEAPSSEAVKMCSQLIEKSLGRFDDKFEDEYQNQLVALIKAKKSGDTFAAKPDHTFGATVNLMDALKAAVDA
jgi:DNA end-binding protein Ku|tara:strand:+ start:13032 stop:13835 length:804 start_codon:yes stop_codon:yes gene_type:complete